MPGALYQTILPSASRTVLQTGNAIGTGGRQFLIAVLDLTSVNGVTPGLTLSIEGYDKVSAKWYNILSGAAVVAVSTNVYKVGPGLPATANVSANSCLPGLIRITIAVADADAATYSVGICLM